MDNNFINRILNIDCLQGLKQLPDGIVNTCVTSPPYYGLRDYGTAEWEGGDAECDHIDENANKTSTYKVDDSKREEKSKAIFGTTYREICPKCGAIRKDNQIGLEETPEAFVQKLVEIFREVKRVLRDDGTVWLNLGDSYAGSGMGAANYPHLSSDKQKSNHGSTTAKGRGGMTYGLKPKDLIGIPWMVAFALRADGWYLRQDIIWHKPNPMPESVTDRCTKSHEYIFLLSKSQQYYYDYESIREKQTGEWRPRDTTVKHPNSGVAVPYNRAGNNEDGHRNRRSVWTVTTRPFSEAHFATFPERLIEPCILAGCPEGGLVLDPFMGAGTTALLAAKKNRHFIGFELNADYIKIAEKRLEKELGMFNPIKK